MEKTDRTEDRRKEQVEIMIIEAVRRIIAPALAVLTAIMELIRAITIVAGVITIITALKEEMAGRTINSEDLHRAERHLHRMFPQRTARRSGTTKNAASIRNAINAPEKMPSMRTAK